MRPTWKPPAMASKKRYPKLHRAARCHGQAQLQTRSELLVRGLQETYAALVVARAPLCSAADAIGELGHSSQCFRGCAVDSQFDLLPAALGVVAQNCRGRYELHGC